ncbi:MAG: hypothetical protein JW748_01500 [Anaerolineales bacterium]|nr:hypothetical protein [Anaerolineales bacterium]
MKNHTHITYGLILLTAVACNLAATAGSSVSPTQSVPEKGRCGDGVCTKPENESVCPADCAPGSITADSSAPVLYYGIMVHLEGWDDARAQGAFERHAELVRRYATLFETYGARLTLESKEFTDGCIAWGDNVLKEMEDRGHGIGVHADIGGEADMNCAEFAPLLRERKRTLEGLGVQVRHVSGIVSSCDWVTAAADAGYLFTSGTVAYALMSLRDDLRPAGFADCAGPGACHQAYPFDLAGRLHPWRMNSGEDWILHDPNGRLVILPSGGSLTCAAEEADSNDSYTKCDFTAADIDGLIAELEKALSYVEAGVINTYYVSWSIGAERDEALLEDFLRRVKPYVDDGRVQWKTLPEMYDLFTDWEKALS